MDKRDAREMVLTGKVTIGVLRRALQEAKPMSWERSVVNHQFSKDEALNIFRKAIAADQRPDDTMMCGGSVGDEMRAINIVRELGAAAIVRAIGR